MACVASQLHGLMAFSGRAELGLAVERGRGVRGWPYVERAFVGS